MKQQERVATDTANYKKQCNGHCSCCPHHIVAHTILLHTSQGLCCRHIPPPKHLHHQATLSKREFVFLALATLVDCFRYQLERKAFQ